MLAGHPELTVGQAPARARYLAEQEHARAAGRGRVPVPEFGVVTLLAAAGDGPRLPWDQKVKVAASGGG